MTAHALTFDWALTDGEIIVQVDRDDHMSVYRVCWYQEGRADGHAQLLVPFYVVSLGDPRPWIRDQLEAVGAGWLPMPEMPL